MIESRHPAEELTSSITEYLVRSGDPLLLTQENRDARCKELNIKIVGTKPSDLVGVPLKQHQRPQLHYYVSRSRSSTTLCVLQSS
ncbi:MAG: hypothetical protein ABF267_05295 [Glaciecola sp.]